MTAQRRERDFTETASSERASSSPSSTPSTSTTSTTMAHGAGRILDPQDLEAIRTGYADVLGALNAVKARDIERAISCGLDASAILDAIEQTALAPRPSHAYLRAILERYAREEITSAERAERDREVHRLRQQSWRDEQTVAWYNPPMDPWGNIDYEYMPRGRQL